MRRRRCQRRGAAAVVMIVMLLMVNLVVVAITLGLSRDQYLTARNVETLRAFYAAEAGVNMAIREIMEESDEDGDGTIGGISDDSNDATDPSLIGARVVVTATADSPLAGQTTVVSKGRSVGARRSVQTLVE